GAERRQPPLPRNQRHQGLQPPAFQHLPGRRRGASARVRRAAPRLVCRGRQRTGRPGRGAQWRSRTGLLRRALRSHEQHPQ
nr:hypothetical protein [Tanacetum cinerariifolium]